MGSGMANPGLPPPPIYRRIFHVPKGGGKSGFYCMLKMLHCSPYSSFRISNLPAIT
jgi:hypothetical protein